MEALLQLIADVRTKLPSDILARIYVVSATIAGRFLGEEWLKNNITEYTGNTDFFKNDWISDTRRSVHMLRVVELAELLFNLQGIAGARHVVTKLKTEDVESVFAELESGKLLALANVPFEFHKPTGKLTEGYDLDVRLNGQNICVDTKCKMEGTSPNENGIFNALNDGRSQLPAYQPGMFFVKLPQGCEVEEYGPIMERAANRFMRGTGRVVAVLYYLNCVYQLQDAVAGFMFQKQFTNTKHRFGGGDWQVVKTLDMQRWISLPALCQ